MVLICNSLVINETEQLYMGFCEVHFKSVIPIHCVPTVSLFTLYYFTRTFSCFFMVHIMSLKFLLSCYLYTVYHVVFIINDYQ